MEDIEEGPFVQDETFRASEAVRDSSPQNGTDPNQALLASALQQHQLTVKARDSKLANHALQPQLQSIEPPTDHRLQTFIDFILNRVPVRLIPVADRELLCHRFNARLQQAKEQGVEVSDVSMGDDCLPTWPGWNWDPETESLSAVIQERLAAAEFSRDLGILLRKDIINKGTKRLKQASASGISINDISFGLDLLPQWPQLRPQPSPQPYRENPSQIQRSDSGYFNSESSVISTTAISHSSSSLFSTSNDDLHLTESDSLDCEQGSEDVDVGNVRLIQSNDEKSRDKIEVDDSDASSITTGSDDSFNESDNAEDLSPKANIVHDIELVGGAKGTDLIDMEVYLAYDSDIDDIPELELAVDREGYEHYFDSIDAMDVELPESITCTGFVDPSDNESEYEDDEGLTRDQELLRQMGLRHGWVTRCMSKKSQAEHVERLVAARRAMEDMKIALLNSQQQADGFEEREQVDYESESNISEEGVTTDEDEDEDEEPVDEEIQPKTSEGVHGDATSDEVDDEMEDEFEDVLQIE